MKWKKNIHNYISDILQINLTLKTSKIEQLQFQSQKRLTPPSLK